MTYDYSLLCSLLFTRYSDISIHFGPVPRRIKMSMVITLIVMIPISVAYGFMNMNCGDAGLKALKQKEHLHVIDESWRCGTF